MPFHKTVAAFQQRVAGPITLAYQRRVNSGSINLDSGQLSLTAALDSLYFSLSGSSSIRERFQIPDEYVEAVAGYYGGSGGGSSSLLPSGHTAGIAILATAYSFVNPPPRGIYVHGSVGIGKSMLMDMFYSICDAGYTEKEDDYPPIQRRCRRCHFHEFMLDVHSRIHSYKKNHPKGDPIPPVAASLAKDARMLCFDEMQITDIADAMIVKRLFTILLDLGVVVVTTSNRPPWGLYEGGINRSVFMPFIDTLRKRMVVIEMGGTHDYRRDGLSTSASTDVSDDANDEALLPPYLCPSTNPAFHQRILEEWFSKGGTVGEARIETIPVAMGRSLRVKKANDTCGWFSFDELCNRPLGAADYIAISGRFDMVIIDSVQQLDEKTYNEARRFVTLIDALYEARTKLIISANVPRENLFVGFDATIDTNDGDEEIAIEDTTLGNQEIIIVGEGGSSSSSSTTLVNTQNGEVEWSATGRLAVSLAQLSAVREVSFSFERAESRLAEMAAANWGR